MMLVAAAWRCTDNSSCQLVVVHTPRYSRAVKRHSKQSAICSYNLALDPCALVGCLLSDIPDNACQRHVSFDYVWEQPHLMFTGK